MMNTLPDAMRAGLAFAAAPTFATMALWSASSESSSAFCGGSSGGGMITMYLLMSAFHMAPWLRLIARADEVRT